MNHGHELAPLRARIRACLLSAALVAGCTPAQNQPSYPNLGGDRSPNVGLYTPGNTLGLAQLVAAAKIDAGMIDAGVAAASGNRCVGYVAAGAAPPDADGGTEATTTDEPQGNLTVDLMTEVLRPPPVKWAPDNVGAIWIEDPAGTYLKTIQLWAGMRLSSLYEWNVRACTMLLPNKNHLELELEPDAVSTATLSNHSQPHHAVWTGKDLHGNVVPDGKYELLIEVAESEAGGPLVKFEFEKSRSPMMITEQVSAPYKSLKLAYEPVMPQ